VSPAASLPDPLTIVHVTAPAPVGGLESVVSALARGHAATGHRVHVVSVFDAGAVGRALAEGIPGVTTHVVAIPPRRYWQERAAVAAIGRAVGADIVHTHGYRPDVVDGPVARLLGVPMVTTVHGFAGVGLGGSVKGGLFEWLELRAFRGFDAVVAVSKPLVERLIAARVPALKIHCIQNALLGSQPLLDRATARSRLGLPAQGAVVGWVGRLSREKGPDVFLRALSLLGGDAPVAAFVGDGPEAASLRAAAAALGLEGRIVWCGRVEAAAALLPAFDAFVLSSRTEGTPIVLLEAMAARVPVIATRVGGVPDVVSEADGSLVASDDPDALAQALRRVLSDSVASAARASLAHARLQRDFAPGPWLERYEALYRDAIGRRRAAGHASAQG